MWKLAFLLCLAVASSTEASLEDLASRAAEHLRAHAGEGGKLLRNLYEIGDDNRLVVKSRQKRLIELPAKTSFKVKWTMDYPIQTFTRFSWSWHGAFSSSMKYPSEFFHKPEGPKFAELLPQKYKDKLYQKASEYATHQFQQAGYHHRHKRAAQADRHALYSVVQSYIERLGLPARECFLRSVCEVAETPFEEDLLGVMINTVFSPSKGGEDSEDEEYWHFLTAENHGRRNGSCDAQYSGCPLSVFDAIPYVKRHFL